MRSPSAAVARIAIRGEAAAVASSSSLRPATGASAARCLSTTSSYPELNEQHHASASASTAAAAGTERGAASGSPFSDAERQQRKRSRVMLDYVANMGSAQTRETAYRPFKTRLDPVTAKELTVSHLLAATAQIGHTTSSFARANQANVYGIRHQLAIIDVEKATLPALRRAAAVVRAICERDGVVLFLGTRPGQQAAVIAAAKRLGENGYHVTTDRWLPGSITNAPKLLAGAVSHALATSTTLQDATSADDSSNGPTSSSDSDKLAAQTLQPDLVIVLNPVENLHAIREATQCNIPTVAIVDTDVDPRTVTYPIPANDDSLRAVELIVGVLSKAGEQGLRDRQRKLDEQDKQMRRAARRVAPAGPQPSFSSAARAAAGPRNEYTEARDAEAREEVDSATDAAESRNARRAARSNQ
ncbi:hypothetical protein OC835_007305 [Tilletia horrida]|nr:hypothetical protein OC835_007305 [Tilletia horrida]